MSEPMEALAHLETCTRALCQALSAAHEAGLQMIDIVPAVIAVMNDEGMEFDMSKIGALL